MKKLVLLLLVIFTLTSSKNEEDWTDLLDENLAQWDTYLSYRHQIGYDGEVPKDENGREIEPIGLNPKSQNVFTVNKEGNENVLHVSGEIYGCVATKNEYQNYHFKLQVKWGDMKWAPRKPLLKDSGILYHSIGAHGAEYWRSWMLSQEFQIMEGHMGDFWNQATSAIDIKAFLPEYIMNPVADESQPFLSLGEGEEIPGFCLRSANYENKSGEWNTLELICYEGKSLHIVNGHVVMILKNSRYVHDGEKIPLVKGKIQLQSEAAEVYYKNIKIRNLESIPLAYKVYFN